MDIPPGRDGLHNWWASLVAQIVKSLSAMQETRVWPPGWKDPLEKEMATTPVCLPVKSRQESLAGYSPWGHKESDMPEGTNMMTMKISMGMSRERETGKGVQTRNCLNLDVAHLTFNYSPLAQTGHKALSKGKEAGKFSRGIQLSDH